MTGRFSKLVRAVACGLCAVVIVSSLGCSKGPEYAVPELFPVSGTVKLEGKPLAGAQVVFVPDKKVDVKKKTDPTAPPLVNPGAETDDEGNYALMWGDHEGAPAGKYKVIVIKFGEIPKSDDPDAAPPSLIPSKYM